MPMKQGDVYACQKCGTRVQVLRNGEATLYCCGQPMVELQLPKG